MKPPAPAVRQQIRGSTLLVGGRLIGAASNFAGQIILVRYLAQNDYGSLAYALSIVTFCQALSMLGMRTTVSRFVPLHHERGEREKLVGILVLAVATTATVGMLLVALLAGWPAALSRLAGGDGTSLRLMAVLAYMIPLQALDTLLINLFASFGKTREIFVRKFIVTPALKIGIVLVLVLTHSTVIVMAYGYLVGAVIALLVSGWGVVRVLRHEGLLGSLRPTLGGISVGRLYRFSVSILFHDLVQPLMHSVNVFILGYYFGPAEVAIYAVVLPMARLNRIVIDNVRVLYMPLAARLFARGDGPGLNDLYWQTAIWMMLASFPIFGLTFVAAGPLIELLFGAEYASSSTILMLLVGAYYFNVSVGCNGHTLRMLGRVRYLLGVDALTAVVNVVGNLVLIRHYGALGAGICTAGTMVLQAILRQFGLRAVGGLAMLDVRCLTLYPFIAAGTLGMLAVQRLGSPNLYLAVLSVAVTSTLLFAVTRKQLQIGEVFPELTRVPLLRMLVT
jgi:O-antigen/teichoic acid export membrane protein